MTYTILSARWGNEDKTSAVIMTVECAAVAVSVVDTPEEWSGFMKWADSNPVEDLPVVIPPTPTLTPLQVVQALRAHDAAKAKALLDSLDELDRAEFFASDRIRVDEPRLVAALQSIGLKPSDLIT